MLGFGPISGDPNNALPLNEERRKAKKDEERQVARKDWSTK